MTETADLINVYTHITIEYYYRYIYSRSFLEAVPSKTLVILVGY